MRSCVCECVCVCLFVGSQGSSPVFAGHRVRLAADVPPRDRGSEGDKEGRVEVLREKENLREEKEKEEEGSERLGCGRKVSQREKEAEK